MEKLYRLYIFFILFSFVIVGMEYSEARHSFKKERYLSKKSLMFMAAEEHIPLKTAYNWYAWEQIPLDFQKNVIQSYYYQKYLAQCKKNKAPENSFLSVFKFVKPSSTYHLHGLPAISDIYQQVAVITLIKKMYKKLPTDLNAKIASYLDPDNFLLSQVYAARYHPCRRFASGKQAISNLQIGPAFIISSSHGSNSINLWDYAGNHIRSLHEHKAPITALCLNKNYMASADKKGIVKTWSNPPEKSRASLVPSTSSTAKSAAGTIKSLAFSDDILFTGSKKRLSLWDATNNIFIKAGTVIGGTIRSLAAFDGYFAYAECDHNIVVLDTKNTEFVHLLMGHSGTVRKIESVKMPVKNSAKNYLISASDDKTIKIWDCNNNFTLVGSLVTATKRPHYVALTNHHLVAAQDTEIILWNLEQKKDERHIKHHHTITALAACGETFVCGDSEGNILLWHPTCNFQTKAEIIDPIDHILVLLYGNKKIAKEEQSSVCHVS